MQLPIMLLCGLIWIFKLQSNAAFHYVYYGGYPGAAPLIADEERWKRYVIDSLIETTIPKDILSLSFIQKPDLLRQVFHLVCLYSDRFFHTKK